MKRLVNPPPVVLMGPVAIVGGPPPDRWLIWDRRLGEWSVLGSVAFLLLLPLDAVRVLVAIVRR